MSIPVPQNTPEIDKAEKNNRHLMWVIAGGVVALIVGVSFLLLFHVGDSARQSTTQRAADRSLAISERQDCRTAYSSDRNVVVERAAAVERQANIDFAGYLLGDPTTRADVLQSNKAALEAANEAVLALPTLNDMVDHGYTLNGKSHPACPVVH